MIFHIVYYTPTEGGWATYVRFYCIIILVWKGITYPDCNHLYLLVIYFWKWRWRHFTSNSYITANYALANLVIDCLIAINVNHFKWKTWKTKTLQEFRKKYWIAQEVRNQKSLILKQLQLPWRSIEDDIKCIFGKNNLKRHPESSLFKKLTWLK